MKMFKKKKKNLLVAMNSDNDKDSYNAAVTVAKKNIKELGEKPSFSIAYISCSVDPREVLIGLNQILGEKNWIGLSSDRTFDNKNGFNNNKISLCSFDSKNIHFNVGVAENYRDNPRESGFKATRNILQKAKSDKLNNFVQYTRLQKKGFEQIVKESPYFFMTYICGSKISKGKIIPGYENEFLTGIVESAGTSIPIFGGSASSDFYDYIKNKDTINFICANGKLYTNAAIVIFVTTNLKFKIQVEHGFDTSSDFAVINKVDKTGFKILEINNKEPVSEYARILKIDKNEFLKEPDKYTLTRPLGLVGIDGKTYVKEVLISSDKKTFDSTYKLKHNTVVNILNFNSKKTFNTIPSILRNSNKKGDVVINILSSCVGRRLLLENQEKKEMENLKKNFKHKKTFGLYSFSEIGSTKTSQAQVHSFTITSLTLYNDLIID